MSNPWLFIERILPPKHPSNPGRSIDVLICDEGSTYADTIRSSYYDYDAGIWINDYYKDKIELDPMVSHWMPIPATDHPLWIDAAISKPKQMEVTDDGKTPEFTKEILVRNMTGNNDPAAETLISVQYNPKDNYWFKSFLEQDIHDEDYGEVQVTHWMPLPIAPLHEEIDIDDDSYGEDPRIMVISELASLAVAIDELVTGNVADEEEYVEDEQDEELEEEETEEEEESAEEESEEDGELVEEESDDEEDSYEEEED